MDDKNAFANVDLKGKLYIEPPEGFYALVKRIWYTFFENLFTDFDSHHVNGTTIYILFWLLLDTINYGQTQFGMHGVTMNNSLSLLAI